MMTARRKPGPKPNPATSRPLMMTVKVNDADLAMLDRIVATHPAEVSRSAVIREAIRRWYDEIQAARKLPKNLQ